MPVEVWSGSIFLVSRRFNRVLDEGFANTHSAT
ncbi:hypothetical protein EYZ11_012371 [Aspergillus tanneri]|uniref:Uncharacterized protein n=1 Tax=Aspergillus tanneri TaxID=1220188 RepID=A0A4S3J0D9_9EURO|nr:hypothetical protein EYZ11_012371 [Aspergillus tanneri]